MSHVVSRCVDIYGVRLSKLNAKQEAFDGDLDMLRMMRATRFRREEHGEALLVDVKFHVEMANESDESKSSPPVAVEAEFTLTYNVEGLADIDDDHLDAFAQANGAYNAWPYWRELLHSMLGRMGLPDVVLPVYRVEERPEPDEAETASPQLDQPSD